MLFPSINLCSKTKSSGIVFQLYFLHDFWRKIFVLLYSINWPNFIVSLSSWDIGQYVYRNCLLTRLWPHRAKKSSLVSGNRSGKSLTLPHSRMCIRIYIFRLKKTTNKQQKNKNKKKQKKLMKNREYLRKMDYKK